MTAQRAPYHAVENDEPPLCPRCRTPMLEEVYTGYFQPWLETGEEPTIKCPTCGWEGLAGDWVGEFSFVVGAPAITFHNWPELTPAFKDDLRRRLGGRTAIVRANS